MWKTGYQTTLQENKSILVPSLFFVSSKVNFSRNGEGGINENAKGFQQY